MLWLDSAFGQSKYDPEKGEGELSGFKLAQKLQKGNSFVPKNQIARVQSQLGMQLGRG
jgi:hypothetical protein